MNRLPIVVVTGVLSVAAIGICAGTLRAEPLIVPPLAQFLRETSVYLLKVVRLNVSRRVFENRLGPKPLGVVTWHTFQVEEVLSRRGVVSTDVDPCARSNQPDTSIPEGEVALPFASFEAMDAVNGPFGSDYTPPMNARFIAFVVQCSPTIMHFPYVSHGLARIADDGRIEPALRFSDGTSLSSVADTRARIAQYVTGPAAQ
jgi:hypothetical protein